MKVFKFIAIASAALAIVACGNSKYPAGATKEQKAQIDSIAPSKAQIDSVSYLLGINYGAFLVQQGFKDDVEMGQLLKGIKDFLAAKGEMNDPDFTEQFPINPMDMGAIIGRYVEQKESVKGVKNQIEQDNFLASNGAKEGVKTTASGLQYEILEQGNDVVAGPADTVNINYTGKFVDGKVFDENTEIDMNLDRVVPGFREGLQLVGEGGSIVIYVPSELGYKDGQRNPYTGQYTIEANKLLIFEVQVNNVRKKVEAPAEEPEKAPAKLSKK